MNKKTFSIALTICMIGLLSGSFMIVRGAPSFTDSFETGSLSPNWTPYMSSSLTLDQTTVNSGSYSVKVDCTGGDTANIYAHPISSPPNPIYLREYVYVSSAMLTVPSSDGDYYQVGGFADTQGYNYGNGELCVFNVGGTLYWGLYIRNNGDLSGTGFTRWIAGTSAATNTTANARAITPGWHSLELEHTQGPAGPNGHEKLTVDGTVIIDVATDNSDRTTSYVVIGGSQSVTNPSSTWTYYIDDVAVSADPIGAVQFQLTMSTNAGTTTPASGLNPEGSQIAITATPPTISPENAQTERYIFLGWTGTGTGSYTGSNNPATITMNGPISETAAWEHQYKLTITSPVGTVNGNNTWYDVGTTTTAAVTSGTIDGATGTRYVFSGWEGDATGSGLTSDTITMDGPKTATADWTTQYFLTTSTAHGSITTSNPSGWYDESAIATATLDALTSPGTTGVQYAFTNWATDATGTTLTSNPITMDGPKTASTVWQTQYNLTVTQSGVDSDFTSDLVTVNGNNYGRDGYSVWANEDAAFVFNYSAQAIVSDTTTQYLLEGIVGNTTATSITVSQPTVVNATYSTQYYLTVTSQYDSPTPTSRWYDNGTSITAYVSSPASGYTCSGWTGTGSVPASGATSVVSFAIVEPSSITWNWQTGTTPTSTPSPTSNPTPRPTVRPTVQPTATPTPTPTPTPMPSNATATPTVNPTSSPDSSNTASESPLIYVGVVIVIVVVVILVVLLMLRRKK